MVVLKVVYNSYNSTSGINNSQITSDVISLLLCIPVWRKMAQYIKYMAFMSLRL